jgi:eukaryotic-like serine/threonine-protein kinase
MDGGRAEGSNDGSGGERIGGYRVLRRLGEGARATILLAHGGDPPETVVLKTTAADDAGALREAAALDRGAGEHVIPLLDAAADDERLALVLPRLPGRDLARLLAERTALEGGEAVTILAPLASTVWRLHDAGVAHGALGPACVLFDDDGAPMLTGFGCAAVFAASAPEVERERVPEVAADRIALRRLASTVLGRVTGVRRTAAQRLLAEIEAASGSEVAELLAGRVFEVAAALPVREADPPTVPAAAGSRLIPISAPVEEPGASGASGAGWAARVEALIERSPAAEAKAALARQWGTWSPGRRRLVIGVGAGVLALVIAVVAIPGPGGSSAAVAGESVPSSGASSSGAPSPGASSGTAGTAKPRPTGSASGGASSGGASAEDAALRGDDPVAAAALLLRTRESCRRELSVLCLDAVDQDGSAAAESDRDAIRGAQDGGELGPDRLPASGDAAPQLSERIGDSALIALAGGASALLVRDGGAWRIRDLLAAPTASGARTPTTPPPSG